MMHNRYSCYIENELVSHEISLICFVLNTEVLKINKLLLLTLKIEYFNQPC